MKSLPKFLKKYFWDVDFSQLDKKLHSRFIIERILEYGDKKSVNWMKRNFKPAQIKDIISKSKNLSPRSANFWQLIFQIDRNKILCLKKSFQERQKSIWKP